MDVYQCGCNVANDARSLGLGKAPTPDYVLIQLLALHVLEDDEEGLFSLEDLDEADNVWVISKACEDGHLSARAFLLRRALLFHELESHVLPSGAYCAQSHGGEVAGAEHGIREVVPRCEGQWCVGQHACMMPRGRAACQAQLAPKGPLSRPVQRIWRALCARTRAGVHCLLHRGDRPSAPRCLRLAGRLQEAQFCARLPLGGKEVTSAKR
mmetsp:Transcript_6916/g.18776  ORF Transcript_6916/g.18776 Transcript_6916/m.18776 type:complete len:211 (-) Transcript_6916:8-640(-)